MDTDLGTRIKNLLMYSPLILAGCNTANGERMLQRFQELFKDGIDTLFHGAYIQNLIQQVQDVLPKYLLEKSHYVEQVFYYLSDCV